MGISFISYLISTLISIFFLIRIFQIQKTKPNHIAKDFLIFFSFGFLYFFIRTISLFLFTNNMTLLAYSYPVSHIFLYLSYSFMLETAIYTSRFSKYSKIALKLWTILGLFIVAVNFWLINTPLITGGAVDWGLNKYVSYLHLGYSSISVVAISLIFLVEAFKKKPIDLKFLFIAIGFGILPLSVLKHFFMGSFFNILFEFNMIIGISVVAVGLTIGDKAKQKLKINN